MGPLKDDNSKQLMSLIVIILSGSHSKEKDRKGQICVHKQKYTEKELVN